ncbi:hypothetical protein Sjap_024790 [Stephania japonica]|uniref:Uncharacterized protein n=1 Tax=Stephania japonica TaxID=461633 RepID=A0AAP0EL90_9MAGN
MQTSRYGHFLPLQGHPEKLFMRLLYSPDSVDQSQFLKCRDPNTQFPNILPEHYKSCELLEGDGKDYGTTWMTAHTLMDPATRLEHVRIRKKRLKRGERGFAEGVAAMSRRDSDSSTSNEASGGRRTIVVGVETPSLFLSQLSFCLFSLPLLSSSLGKPFPPSTALESRTLAGGVSVT